MMQVEKTEKTIERINTHPGVEGVIVTEKDGTPINTTMDNTQTVMYAEMVRTLTGIANSMVRDVDPTNELEYIRIGTQKVEVMAKTDPDYCAIVVQSMSVKKKAGPKN